MSGPAEERRLDRWADWLLSGRQRGLSEKQVRRLAGRLRRVRDRVLRGTHLRQGRRLLDVGAGTGLLALEACRRLGPNGAVIALDVSTDSLRACRRQADANAPQPTLRFVTGDALHLPFADASFDAVTTRSVLIYLPDKAAGIRELFRVLRPGGWASIFEPVNDVEIEYAWNWGTDLSPVQPDHDRIVAYLRDRWLDGDTMLGFDERDLTRWFREAGFRAVRLSYEYAYDFGTDAARDSVAFLRARPNPGMLSYDEAARAVVGEGADEHLRRLAKLLLSRPLRGARAAAYVSARR